MALKSADNSRRPLAKKSLLHCGLFTLFLSIVRLYRPGLILTILYLTVVVFVFNIKVCPSKYKRFSAVPP